MLWNYLKIAFRNVIRGKGYSLINILGLAIGMAICILVLVWTKYEYRRTLLGLHLVSPW